MKRTIFITGLTFFLVSCGIFKKNKSVDRAELKKEKIDLTREIKGITLDSRLKDVETTELIIRIPQTKDFLETTADDEYHSIQEELSKLIRRSDSIVIRMSREREKSLALVDTSTVVKNVTERIDSSRVVRDVKKTGDSTWLANFNPWVILGVAAMVIFAVFMYFRTKRI
ncbi:MAG: hypothetical protein ACRDE7_00090 [Sphingobacterium sp.]